jgi:lipopolysaccharide export system permease protein
VLLGLIGFLLSLLCTLVLIPRGIGEGRRLMHQALTTRVDAGLEERTFFDALKNLILYVEKIDPATGVLTNVFIRESSQPDEVKTIIARKGKVVPNPEGKALILHLREGSVVSEDRSGDSTGALMFESQIFRYQIQESAMETSSKSLEELSIGEVRERIRKAQEQREVTTGFDKDFNTRLIRHGRVVIAQRITYPLACLALALTAFPLGMINMGRSRLNNVAVGLVVIFAYYAVTLAAERAARSGLALPELSLCIPAVLFFAAAGYLIRCVHKEQMPAFFNFVQRTIRAVRRE